MIGSLCSGISGLDMGVTWATGARTAWFCEREPAPVRVLRRHYPGVPIYDDLKTTDWSTVEPVDIITAGYPCQPFSMAGLRKGTDDERHLWPFVADAIRRVEPRYVVLENVRGHLTLGFDAVLGELADLGFDANWAVLRASDVGAPHRRERMFLVATNTNNLGHERGRDARHRWAGSANSDVDAANADGVGWDGRATRKKLGVEREYGESTVWSESLGVAAGSVGPAADTDGATLGKEQVGIAECSGPMVAGLHHAPAADMGAYETAINRWERHHGAAPHPLADGRLNPRFVEWMMGYPVGWVDGLTRSEALKALGNAVVPHVAALAWQELA